MTEPSEAESQLERMLSKRSWRAQSSSEAPDLKLLPAGLGLPAELQHLTFDQMSSKMTGEWSEWALELIRTARDRDPSGTFRDFSRVHVGILSTHHINASSWVMEDESALIVLNDALITLIYEISRALAGRIALSAGEEGVVNAADAQAAVMSVLDWVRITKTAEVAHLDLPAENLHVAYDICDNIERFLIAHEVAHLILGHHDNLEGRARNIWITACDEAIANGYPTRLKEEIHQEEHNADTLAISLMVRMTKYADNPPAIGGLLEAVQLFFYLQEHLESFTEPSCTHSFDDHWPSHPPARMRGAIIRLLTWGAKEPDPLEFAQLGHLAGLLDGFIRNSQAFDRRRLLADLAIDRSMHQCWQSVPPDYAFFEQLTTDASRAHGSALIYSGLIERMASELVNLQPGATTLEKRVGSFHKFKLAYSQVRHASPARRFALLQTVRDQPTARDLEKLLDVGIDE